MFWPLRASESGIRSRLIRLTVRTATSTAPVYEITTEEPYRNGYRFAGRYLDSSRVSGTITATDDMTLGKLVLQGAEVSEVRWFDQNEVWKEIKSSDRHHFCVPTQSLELLRDYLGKSLTPSC